MEQPKSLIRAAEEWDHLDPGKLHPAGRQVLILRLKGYSQRETAQELGFHEKSVARICRSHRYQVALNHALDAMDRQFIDLLPRVYEALEAGLASPDVSIRLRAAEIWFRHSGYDECRAAENTQSAEDLALAIVRQVEARRLPGLAELPGPVAE
jgi:hypothetical protein